MRAKIFKILFFLATAFMALLFLLFAVINSKTFQTWITKKAGDYLSAEFKTKISVGGVKIRPFTRLYLNDLYVEDRQQDTLFYIDTLKVNIEGLYFDFKGANDVVHLRSADIRGAVIKFAETDSAEGWNYKFFFDYFEKKDTTAPPSGRKFILTVDNVSLYNAAFAMKSDSAEPSVYGRFNPDDFRFEKIYGSLDNFSIVDDSLSFLMQEMSLAEKHGFFINTASAAVNIYPKGLEFRNLDLETENSILGNELLMNYEDWDDLGEFIQKVRLDADLKNCRIYMPDVAFWGEGMEDLKQTFQLSGKAKGTIERLRGKELRLNAGSETYVAGEFTMKGLPDFYSTYIDFKLEKSHVSMADIKKLFPDIELTEEVERLGRVDFTGKFTGFPKSFVANGRFTTGLGNLASDIKLDFQEGIEKATYSGELRSSGFNIGNYLQEDELGKVAFDANVEGKGLDLKTINATIKGKIDYVELHGYSYKSITLDGTLVGKLFTGATKIRDENLDLDFDGTVDFNDSVPKMDFTSQIRYANLQQLGFDTISSALSCNLVLNFSGNKIDNLQGTATARQILWKRGSGRLALSSVSLFAGYRGGQRQLKLSSELADAEVIGNYNFSGLGVAVNNYISTILPNLVKPKPNEVREDFDFSVNVKTPRILTDFISREFWFDPLTIKGGFNSATPEIHLNANISYIKYKEFEANNLTISTARSAEGVQALVVSCGELIHSDSTFITNGTARVEFDHNEARFSIDVPNSITRLSTSLNGRLDLYDSLYRLTFSDATITSAIRKWTINSNSYIQYDARAEKTIIHDLRLTSDSDQVVIGGSIGSDFFDTLRVAFNNFKLGNVNYFTRPSKGQELNGVIDGYATLYNLMDVPVFTSDINISHLSFSTDTLGNVRLNSNFDREYKNIKILGTVWGGRLKGSEISGYVNFGNKTPNNLNLDFILQNASNKLAEPFLEDIASDFTGTFTANVKILGSFSDPNITGNIDLKESSFKVDYLQTRYFVNHTKIVITKDKFSFTPFTMTDENQKAASVQGYISHKAFSNFYINLSVDGMNSFMVLNTTREDNDLYFGKAFMTGNFRLTGPFEDLLMQVNGKTEHNTEINLLLGDGDAVGTYDFIQFVDENEKVNRTETKQLSGIRIILNLAVTTDALIKIIFDSQLGDVMQGRGTANLRMEVNTLGDFKMYGTFVIDQGNYIFTAFDLVNRPFTVRKGGTVSWTGDPLNARINIQAVYRSRTPLEPLVVGVVSDADLPKYRNPVWVEAVLELKGQMMKPDIKFGINIPDLSYVSGTGANTSVLLNALKKIENDQEEMSRQVFSMLATGRLTTPIENSYAASNTAGGNPTGADIAANTAGNFLSSQLTNWLSKADPKWRVGVQIGSAGQSQAAVIVNAGRSFWNDRILVDLSYDPNTTLPNVSASYLITPTGNAQLRAFNRNTNNPIYNQNIPSQGVGFYVRAEFEDFAEFKQKIRNLFRKKEEEEAEKNKQQKPIPPVEIKN